MNVFDIPCKMGNNSYFLILVLIVVFYTLGVGKAVRVSTDSDSQIESPMKKWKAFG